MLNRLFRRARMPPTPAPEPPVPVVVMPPWCTQRDLLRELLKTPHWDRKIEIYKGFGYSPAFGVWVGGGDPAPVPMTALEGRDKVNYGCGGNLIEDWLNVDLYASESPGYRQVNLLEKHPFADNAIRYGFSEDMLEHLTQAESIFFLAEIHRTLAPGGVMRLSFPGLEGVLVRHYSPPTEERIRQGEFEAYAFWDHVHFYSREELRLVAEHLGFSGVRFVEYGVSDHRELAGRDTRESQRGLNTYVELTK